MCFIDSGPFMFCQRLTAFTNCTICLRYTVLLINKSYLACLCFKPQGLEDMILECI